MSDIECSVSLMTNGLSRSRALLVGSSWFGETPIWQLRMTMYVEGPNLTLKTVCVFYKAPRGTHNQEMQPTGAWCGALRASLDSE